MGDWTHNIHDLNEKGEEKQKGNIIGLMGIELGPSNLKNAIIKFNIRLSVVQRIWNRVPLPNSVLKHKSYVSKYLINAFSKDRNQYLGIFTRCISLVPHNLE